MKGSSPSYVHYLTRGRFQGHHHLARAIARGTINERRGAIFPVLLRAAGLLSVPLQDRLGATVCAYLRLHLLIDKRYTGRRLSPPRPKLSRPVRSLMTLPSLLMVGTLENDRFSISFRVETAANSQSHPAGFKSNCRDGATAILVHWHVKVPAPRVPEKGRWRSGQGLHGQKQNHNYRDGRWFNLTVHFFR